MTKESKFEFENKVINFVKLNCNLVVEKNITTFFI